ncbi:hypothetical protein [Chryseobacterium sp. 3008163]|uniref:hypothetical protein n=1 Tax=Chryseobacterium sp. 3008163 TaxID=2478663 RepID=UPI000F0BF944|nr:hypothetical protein [Chryseobacterium sp. 3008163]AYN00857.1 hypothetical protein EAG08_11520 [Chryseobacterium sp. 3008163]
MNQNNQKMNENMNNDVNMQIENISEQEMLELFKVEELENRLEMAAIAPSQIEAADGNKVCWIG